MTQSILMSLRRVTASTALIVTVSATLAAQPRQARAPDPWVEVRSPHFTVISNAGESRARSVAWQFE